MSERFSELLKELREKRGYSLNKLAEKCGISAAHLSRLESEKRNPPSPKTIQKIAGVLGNYTELMAAAGYIKTNSLNYVRIGNRIKEAREELGLSQAELGDKLGVPEYTVKYYERGKRKISISDLEKISTILGKSLSFLIDLDNGIPEPAELPDELHTTRSIPLFGTIAAGGPNYATQEEIGRIIIPSDLDADFALKVKGESMTGAGIMPGDVAICKKARTAEHGQMVAALVNGDETTLKYLINENGTWKLRAANPKYPDIILNPGEDRIQGIVLRIEKEPPNLESALNASVKKLKEPEHNWGKVASEAARYGLTPEMVERLVRSFGKLKNGLPDNEDNET